MTPEDRRTLADKVLEKAINIVRCEVEYTHDACYNDPLTEADFWADLARAFEREHLGE